MLTWFSNSWWLFFILVPCKQNLFFTVKRPSVTWSIPQHSWNQKDHNTGLVYSLYFWTCKQRVLQDTISLAYNFLYLILYYFTCWFITIWAGLGPRFFLRAGLGFITRWICFVTKMNMLCQLILRTYILK